VAADNRESGMAKTDIAIQVPQLEKAAAFYGGAFELERVNESGIVFDVAEHDWQQSQR
jgi:hypothetical protein